MRVLSVRHMAICLGVTSLAGCSTVIATADVVGTVAVETVGLAADAAIGAAKMAGQVAGKAVDVATGNH